MKFICTSLFLVWVLLCSFFATGANPGGQAMAVLRSLSFTENQGQITDQHQQPRPDIHYKLSAGKGLNVFLGTGTLHYVWARSEQSGYNTPKKALWGTASDSSEALFPAS